MPLKFIELSSQAIRFPEKQKNHNAYTFSISIRNTHQTAALMFKIKTKRLSTYDVKPPKGILDPNQEKKVLFKIIRPLSDDEIQEIILKDKFLIEILVLRNVQISNGEKSNKQKLSVIWKENIEQNQEHESTMLPISFEGKQRISSGQAANTEEGLKSLLKASNNRQQPKQKISDDVLIKKFDELKRTQENLMLQRQKVFKPPEQKGNSGKTSVKEICLLIFLFLLSLVIGNFLRLRVFVPADL